MISHEHRCIFIHIPKCAGTSIEAALGHLDRYSGRGAQDHRSVRMIEQPFPRWRALLGAENRRHARMRLREQRKGRSNPNPANELRVDRAQFRCYFKFTTVRNPWSRAFSWYQNVMRDEGHRRDHGIVGEPSFAAFLAEHAGRGMLRSQLDWLRAYDGTIPMDFIGRFESLRADFGKVCRRLGLSSVELPHRVPGSGSDYREAYDEGSRRLVAEVYREEIALFGYRFDP